MRLGLPCAAFFPWICVSVALDATLCVGKSDWRYAGFTKICSSTVVCVWTDRFIPTEADFLDCDSRRARAHFTVVPSQALEETVTDESGASDVEEDDYSEGEEEEEANVAPMVVREAEPQLRQWRETEAADNTKGEEEEDQDQEEEAKIVPEVARRQWRETEDSSNTREEEEEEVVSTQSLVEDTKSAYARKLARLGLEEEEESVSSSTRALVIDGEGEE